MASLSDYARSKGAGPVEPPLMDLRARLIEEATAWYLEKEHGTVPVTRKERALYRAVRALELALQRAEQEG